MREAVIVSTARTPIGRAYRGAFNDTQAQQLGGHAIRHAVERSGVDPAEIEDVVLGAALQQAAHIRPRHRSPDIGVRTVERGDDRRGIFDDAHHLPPARACATASTASTMAW